MSLHPKPSAQEASVPAAAAQQADNIAHALAGAGGGLLSMTLTSELLVFHDCARIKESD